MSDILLLLETTGTFCSVALARDGRIIGHREGDEPYEHAARLTVFIDELMRETGLEMADLTAIALSSGPGSYTSLRIGAATAKGLVFALGCGFVAVDTLAALAGAVSVGAANNIILPAQASRRNEVYAAAYAADGTRHWDTRALVVEPGCLDELLLTGQQLIVAGTGAELVRNTLPENPAITYQTTVRPRAEYLLPAARLALQNVAFDDAASYQPRYLKSPFVTKSKKRFFGKLPLG
ncbi:MAG: tRNA (adenosine(37)-N6)-threonylcarbamoyltransferase complex dimerization subunit type 1 TsaB [Saprospiraceae bacterium]